jgi:hypothetical protein
MVQKEEYAEEEDVEGIRTDLKKRNISKDLGKKIDERILKCYRAKAKMSSSKNIIQRSGSWENLTVGRYIDTSYMYCTHVEWYPPPSSDNIKHDFLLDKRSSFL